jgi:serine/threonine-protein kinase RsbT
MPPQRLSRTEVPLVSERDLVPLREEVRRAAQAAGLSLLEETKMVTAASELGRNVLVHGGGGRAVVEWLGDERRQGVQATFEDEGPGIPDVALAMQDGYSSVGSLGVGLPGAKRLVDEFEICSEAGAGTRVRVVRWASRSPGTSPAP